MYTLITLARIAPFKKPVGHAVTDCSQMAKVLQAEIQCLARDRCELQGSSHGHCEPRAMRKLETWEERR